MKKENGVHKAGRVSGVNSTLVEESHHVKMQTTCSNKDPSMNLQEVSSKPHTDLSKILTSVEDEEGVRKAERISGVNSTLMEESHQIKRQTTYSNDDPIMHI